MSVKDIISFCARSLAGYPLRTALMLLAMSIGVAAVVLLTALGEGARLYVMQQFSSLGTHLLIVIPGRSETSGGPPPLLGKTPRDLTLDDALALTRSSAVHRVAPIIIGSAQVVHGNRSREVIIMGATAEIYAVRDLQISQGRFLPAGNVSRAEALCVLGAKLKAELFGHETALGAFVRIGQRRFRVIGVLTDKGQSLSMDISDVAIIPVAASSALFNQSSLFRILAQAKNRDAIPRAKRAILEILRARHDGEDDIPKRDVFDAECPQRRNLQIGNLFPFRPVDIDRDREHIGDMQHRGLFCMVGLCFEIVMPHHRG